jgi:outer membrane protein
MRWAVLVGLVGAGWCLGTARPAGAQEAPATGAVSLQEAVRTSIAQNRELAAARMELVGADALVREAWSAVYPTVNASASYTRNLEVPGQFLPARFFDPNAGENEQVLVRFGADNMWQGSLRLEQPLFQAAAFIGVGAAARFNALQQEMVRGKTQEIVTRTRQGYYDVLLAREGVRLNAESVRRVRQTLEETRAMNRAGLVGDYDVLRLEVELSNLEPALRRSENQLLAARRALAVALALDGTEMVEVEGSLSTLSLEDEAGGAAPEDAALLAGFGVRDPQAADERELIAAARANRSDLRQIRLMESLRTAELRAEQSEYLPRLALFATYAFQGQGDGAINPFAFGDARSTTIPQVGLQLTVPVFSGFARPARVQQRRATVLQLDTQAREAEAQIANQVRTLLDQVREARERADAQAHARRQAQRGYEIASVQYREGLGSRLEVTDAEVALRQSEFNYAQAIYDYLTARARLDEAVGAVTVRF